MCDLHVSSLRTRASRRGVHLSQGMAHKHRVFFKGQSWIPQDYFVNIIADTYERMRAVLLENFYFLRYRKFAVAERTDGTYVCDDEYYKSLQPDCDLVVLITGEPTSNLAILDF